MDKQDSSINNYNHSVNLLGREAYDDNHSYSNNNLNNEAQIIIIIYQIIIIKNYWKNNMIKIL